MSDSLGVETVYVSDVARHKGWARLVEGGPPQLSPRWLGAYRDAFGRPQRCVMVRGRDGAPLAGCVFHVRHPRDHHVKYRLARFLARDKIPDGLRSALEQRIEDPVAVVVAPSSYAPGVHRAEAGPDGAAAVSRLIDEVVRIAGADGARTMLVPHQRPRDGETTSQAWAGSCVVDGDRSAHLDLRGAVDFDGYLERFRSARRQQVRRDRRKFAQAGLGIEVRHELVDIDRMVRRQCDHYERHGIVPDPGRVRSQFESLAKAYAGDFRVIEVVRGTDSVGHVLVVVDGQWVLPRLAGFEPGVPFAYFEAGYYSVIELALGPLGRRLVDYGGAAIDAKRLRGCAVTETVDVVGVLA